MSQYSHCLAGNVIIHCRHSDTYLQAKGFAQVFVYCRGCEVLFYFLNKFICKGVDMHVEN